MIDKKKIIAICSFLLLSFTILSFAGGRENLLLYVIFMDSDGSIISEQQVVDGEDALVPEIPSHDGYVFDNWYLYGEDDIVITDFTNIKIDLKVEARYKSDMNNNGIADEDDNYYAVSFYDGLTNELIQSQTILEGMNAKAPDYLIHEGYTFVGWDKSYNNISRNSTIKSQYSNDTEVIDTYYTINFYDLFNKIFDSQRIKDGNYSTTINNIPNYDGYELNGWYLEPNGLGDKYTVGSIVNQSREIYGYWTKIIYNTTIITNNNDDNIVDELEYGSEYILPIIKKYYKASFDLNGGKLLSGEDVVYVESNLIGYCKNSETCSDEDIILPGSNVIVSGNDNYYAIWGNGIDDVVLPNVKKNSTDKYDYEFMGWGNNGIVTNSVPGVIEVNEDIVLKALYKETVRSYSLDIVTNNGSFNDASFINNSKYFYDSKVMLPSLNRSYKLTYILGDDETLSSDKNEYEYQAELLGYCKNSETCSEEELILPGSMITISSNNRYYAIWGSTIDSIDLLSVAKANSVSHKYSFIGYSEVMNGEILYTLPSNIKLNKDMSLYPNYNSVLRTYDMEFDLDGGKFSNEVFTDLEYNSDYKLPSATKSYKLVLDGNGGYINNKSSETLYGDAILLGYMKNGAGDLIPVGTNVKVSESNKYKAIWGSTIDNIILPSAVKNDDEVGSYSFVGYSKVIDGDIFGINSISINSDLTLYAKYNATLNSHIITFNPNKGELPANTLSEVSVEHGKSIPLPIPERDYVLSYDTDGGKNIDSVTVAASFLGWCKESSTCSNPIKDSLEVLSSGTYYAAWGKSIEKVKLPSAVKDSTVAYNYLFNYWRGNSVFPFKANSNYTLDNDTILKAYYKETDRYYNVNFVSVFGEEISSQSIKYNGLITNPGSLVSEGKVFYGWYSSMGSETLWNFEADKVISDMTLYGKWDVSTFSVSYVLNGGALSNNNQGLYENNSQLLLPTPSKHYELSYILNGGIIDEISEEVEVSFKGWCKNSNTCLDTELINGNTLQVINDNNIYYAIWENSSNEVLLRVPTKASTQLLDYTFTNWSNGNDSYLGNTKIKLNGDLVLSANYEESNRKYTVTFNSDYGVVPNSQIVEVNNLVTMVNDLVSEGHVFKGWYKDLSGTVKWDFETDKVMEDITIYAIWY